MNQSRVPDWLIKFIWLLVVLLLFSGYFLLNKPRGSAHILETTVDDWIPLIPGFVFSYISLYVLLAVSVWRFWKADMRLFKLAALAVFTALALSYLIYLFFQTKIERPVIIGSDISSDVLRWFYSIDEPYNAFPSLHTSTSILCALLWRKAGSSIWPIISLWAVLVVASTALVKQHYIADVFGGMAVAILSYYVATELVRLSRRRQQSHD
jgi:membrane-associated phospholipid phosphatase